MVNPDFESEFNDRLNQLSARLFKTLLPGCVAEVQHGDVTLVKVVVVPTADKPNTETTDWVSVLQPRAAAGVKAWLPVAVGDSGILVSPGGVLDSGWFLTGLYSAPPAGAAAVGVPPPLAAEHRDDSAVLQLGGITFRLDSANGTVVLTGTNGVRLDGNLRVVGGISVKDDVVTDAGISHNLHTHTDPAGISGNQTSPPSR